MKYFCLGCIIAFFMQCSSKKDVKLSPEFFDGTWLVTDASITDKKHTEVQNLPDMMLRENSEVLHIYKFQKNGNYQVDTGGAVIIKGTYKLEDSLMVLKNDQQSKFKQFTVRKESDSTAIVITDFPTIQMDTKLVYHIAKVMPSVHFDIGKLDWKNSFASDVSDDVIKEKVEKIVQYYSLYFKTNVQMGANKFSEPKICLPIKFYAGAIGTKPTHKAPGFEKIFGTPNNIKKAYGIISKAFDKPFDYPERGNYLLEYAEALAHLYKQI